jgi:hypothetical protein
MEEQLIHIQNKIYEVRGQKIMLDFDLAEMYQVETKNLKRAVRRNFDHFPADFMFELTENEWDALRCQIGALNNQGRGQHPKYLPFAFTEQGVAQLSSVLNSRFAIEVNITIIRAFVVLRQYALGYAELNSKLEAFMRETNMQFNEVYQALSELAAQKRLPNRPRRNIGYFTEEQREKGEDIII